MTSSVAPPTAEAPLLPPTAEEAEVSLFGRGVGECVVLHLGDGQWMVVDSCNADSKKPVALEYLDRMGVSPSSVVLIVLTHWHDDHTKGATELIRACPRARVAASVALRSSEFLTLLKASSDPLVRPSGIGEMAGVVAELRARRLSGAENGQIVWGTADRKLHRTEHVDVDALSPSDQTISSALGELGALIPTVGQPKRRYVSHSANEVSLVLSVRVGAVEILLGSDLEGRADPATGWEAIIRSPARRAMRACVYKVAHHGAPNGDHDGVWTDLLDAEPWALLTPFNAGRRPRPQPEDVQRIRARTRRAFRAGKDRVGKSKDLPNAVRRMLKETGRNLQPLHGPVGHVRIRGRRDDPGALTVALFCEARPLAE